MVTLSLHAGLSPAAHRAVGEALLALREDGGAIVTSGGVTHNQAEFRRGWFAREPAETTTPWSERFSAWALDALQGDAAARAGKMLQGEGQPDYARAHPTLDHWLPTLVAAGAAGNARGRVLHRGYQHALSTALVAFDGA